MFRRNFKIGGFNSLKIRRKLIAFLVIPFLLPYLISCANTSSSSTIDRAKINSAVVRLKEKKREAEALQNEKEYLNANALYREIVNEIDSGTWTPDEEAYLKEEFLNVYAQSAGLTFLIVSDRVNEPDFDGPHEMGVMDKTFKRFFEALERVHRWRNDWQLRSAERRTKTQIRVSAASVVMAAALKGNAGVWFPSKDSFDRVKFLEQEKVRLSNSIESISRKIFAENTDIHYEEVLSAETRLISSAMNPSNTIGVFPLAPGWIFNSLHLITNEKSNKTCHSILVTKRILLTSDECAGEVQDLNWRSKSLGRKPIVGKLSLTELNDSNVIDGGLNAGWMLLAVDSSTPNTGDNTAVLASNTDLEKSYSHFLMPSLDLEQSNQDFISMSFGCHLGTNGGILNPQNSVDPNNTVMHDCDFGLPSVGAPIFGYSPEDKKYHVVAMSLGESVERNEGDSEFTKALPIIELLPVIRYFEGTLKNNE